MEHYDRVIEELLVSLSEASRSLRLELQSPLSDDSKLEILYQTLQTVQETLERLVYVRAFEEARLRYGPGIFWGFYRAPQGEVVGEKEW